jgi:molecular chaperone DnaK
MQHITIRSSGGLSQADIDRMVRDAEAFADKDKERRAVIDTKNEADSLIYSSERNLEEHGANLPQVRVPAGGFAGFLFRGKQVQREDWKQGVRL